MLFQRVSGQDSSHLPVSELNRHPNIILPVQISGENFNPFPVIFRREDIPSSLCFSPLDPNFMREIAFIKYLVMKISFSYISHVV